MTIPTSDPNSPASCGGTQGGSDHPVGTRYIVSDSPVAPHGVRSDLAAVGAEGIPPVDTKELRKLGSALTYWKVQSSTCYQAADELDAARTELRIANSALDTLGTDCDELRTRLAELESLAVAFGVRRLEDDEKIDKLEALVKRHEEADKRTQQLLAHTVDCVDRSCPICNTLNKKYAAIKAAMKEGK